MKKFISTIFWLLIIALICLWAYEFYNVRNGKEPQFCIKKDVHVYADGTTDVCIGLGYKVYNYNRYNMIGTEFVSIFADERKVEIYNENGEPIESTVNNTEVNE